MVKKDDKRAIEFDFEIENSCEKFDRNLIIKKPIPDHAIIRGPDYITSKIIPNHPGEMVYLGESKDAIKVSFIKQKNKLNNKDI